jgi:hypothetical protein
MNKTRLKWSESQSLHWIAASLLTRSKVAFAKPGVGPCSATISASLKRMENFKYEDPRAEEEQKQEAYEQALLEERSSLSQLAYKAKYGSEEDSVSVRRRLFSASAIDDATVEDRVDEFVKICEFAVFSSLVASRCSFALFFSIVPACLMFSYVCRLLPVVAGPASSSPISRGGSPNGFAILRRTPE